MKINKPKNENYAAIVVEIKTLLPLEKMNNVQAAIIMGNQVIVSKDIKIGDVGLYFPLECQLSKEYLSENNLYRKSELNSDITKKGYFNENGRIRCVKFVGHKSEGLYMPLNSLKIKGFEDFNLLKLNDCFDELDGIPICSKYVVKTNRTPGNPKNKQGKKVKQYESKLIENQFKFHSDTSMLYKNLHMIKPESLISITSKLHGTSGISSYILCKKSLKWYEKTLKKLKVNIVDTTYDFIYSSRKVIKNEELLETKTFNDHYNSLSTSSKKRYVEKYYLEIFKEKIPNEVYRDIFPLTNIGNSLFTIEYFESKLNGFKQYLEQELSFKSKGYYGEDIWGIAHNELKDFLQKGMTFYYEIVGFTPTGTAIQKDYDYGCKSYSTTGAPAGKCEHKIFIYRITQTNIDGKVFEFSAKQVQDFCKKNGLNSVPEVYYGYAKDFTDTWDTYNQKELSYDEWREIFLRDIKYNYNDHNCSICSNKVPEEGVVIRIEGNDLEAYKQKSNLFYARETAQLDKGETNMEDEQSEE